MFFEMRFDLGTLDLGERSLPFGLLVFLYIERDHPEFSARILFSSSRVLVQFIV